jgi:hypothetical protein
MPYRFEPFTPDNEAEWPDALEALLQDLHTQGYELVTSITRDLPPEQQFGGMSGPPTPKPHTVLVLWHA